MTPVEWINSQYLFDIVETTIPIISGTAQACQANSNRICLMIGGFTSATMYVSTKSTLVVSNGLSVTPTTGPFTLSAATHGRLVTVPWFVATTGAPTSIVVFEILFKDR